MNTVLKCLIILYFFLFEVYSFGQEKSFFKKEVLFKWEYSCIDSFKKGNASLLLGKYQDDYSLGQRGDSQVLFFNTEGDIIERYEFGFSLRSLFYSEEGCFFAIDEKQNFLLKDRVDTIAFDSPEEYYLQLDKEKFGFLHPSIVTALYTNLENMTHRTTRFDYGYNLFFSNNDKRIYQVLNDIVVGLDEDLIIAPEEVYYIRGLRCFYSKLLFFSKELNLAVFQNGSSLYEYNLDTKEKSILYDGKFMNRRRPCFVKSNKENCIFGFVDNGKEFDFVRFFVDN